MGKLITIKSSSGDIPAYQAEPASNIKGGLLVVHEVWGIAPHITSVAERFAREGYFAVAPDLLTGTVDVKAASVLQEDLFNPEKRNLAQPKLRHIMTPMMNPEFGSVTAKRLQSCFDYLYAQPQTKKQVAIVGFCFGGTYSFALAVREPKLKLALPFYGHADFSVEELANIKCPIQAFYGERDDNLMQSLPELKSKMQSAQVNFNATVYPDCGHAFFNDTNRFAYNEAAATDAWRKSLAALELTFGS
jgi:carboxymethylenebutenolidase